MRRLLVTVLLCVAMLAAGAFAAVSVLRPNRPPLPDPPALVTQVREAARLEALDVSLYKKISFTEEPPRPTDTLVGDALSYMKFNLRHGSGSAIVFADVHLGVDLSRMDASRLRVEGERVLVQLPAVQATVELKPDETVVIDSNLDSQQTAQMLQAAKVAFEAQVTQDRRLQEKARASAERAIRGLLLGVGFRQVEFVSTLSAPAHPG